MIPVENGTSCERGAVGGAGGESRMRMGRCGKESVPSMLSRLKPYILPITLCTM
jgi:hypothetical protein